MDRRRLIAYLHHEKPLNLGRQVMGTKQHCGRCLGVKMSIRIQGTFVMTRPPLCVALRKGKEAIVRLFLERDDIDPNIETMAKHPLWWGSKNGRPCGQ